eukprot:TRINITY_DN32548_c0_g1_i1.p1 TRINITY_DN32548_c0_g1~~TRINITY_DN32548_c0_g1_i1.p1  ORF type:complete len:107 (-),score=34.54 TRINITY_DN32548_c0_g1_i1:151-426(-)
MHLKAKVIRNLTNLYGVDCIASQKLYKILTRENADASDNLNDTVATSEPPSEHADECEANVSHDTSADELISKMMIHQEHGRGKEGQVYDC